MDTEPVKDEKQGGEILFDIRHLTHTFETEEGKKFDALSDVTATIKKGSFTAIIGTHGSGKSTLARHLNALLIPTDGEIYVEGMKTSGFSHIWDIRQKVGMVFQNPDNQLVAAIVEEDEVSQSSLLVDLDDQEDAAKAIIYSEILTRKY